MPQQICDVPANVMPKTHMSPSPHIRPQLPQFSSFCGTHTSAQQSSPVSVPTGARQPGPSPQRHAPS